MFTASILGRVVDKYIDKIGYEIYINGQDLPNSTKVTRQLDKKNLSRFKRQKPNPYTLFELLPTSERIKRNLKAQSNDRPSQITPFSKYNSYSVSQAPKRKPIAQVSETNNLPNNININSFNSVDPPERIKPIHSNTPIPDGSALHKTPKTFKSLNTDKGSSDASDRPSLQELKQRLAHKIDSLKALTKVITQPSKDEGYKSKKPVQNHNKSINSEHSSNFKIATPLSDTQEPNLPSNIDFGSFLFTKKIADTTTKLSDQNKKGSKLNKIKRSIKQIEKETDFIDQAKESNKVETIKEISFRRALQKSRGDKINTNLKVLKKAEKSIKKKKERSKKKWEKRNKRHTDRVENNANQHGMSKKQANNPPISPLKRKILSKPSHKPFSKNPVKRHSKIK